MSTDPASRPSVYESYYTVVRGIPEGRVVTYGQVAELAGRPRRARQVGVALAVLDDPDIPWHRVVNARGKISYRASGSEDFQRILLEEEGVEFSLDGRIDLDRFGWLPGD